MAADRKRLHSREPVRSCSGPNRLESVLRPQVCNETVRRRLHRPSSPAGTVQPVLDGGKTEIIVPGNSPLMPDYLTAAAQDVWQEEADRVMSAGITDTEARLSCGTAHWKLHDPDCDLPRAAYLTAQRQKAELLGTGVPGTQYQVDDRLHHGRPKPWPDPPAL